MVSTDRYSPMALSAICSNLSKACSKQLRSQEADLLTQLSDYYASQAHTVDSATFGNLEDAVQNDLISLYPPVAKEAEEMGDRGSQRALTWGKKVTSIQKSLLGRFRKQQETLLESGDLYVCEACGFIGLGSEAPAICPICKAPASRFSKIS